MVEAGLEDAVVGHLDHQPVGKRPGDHLDLAGRVLYAVGDGLGGDDLQVEHALIAQAHGSTDARHPLPRFGYARKIGRDVQPVWRLTTFRRCAHARS